jgi:homeobox protein CDX1/4
MDNGVMPTNGQSMLSQSQNGINTSSIPTSNLSSFLDVKPKIDPSIHLQHLHQMSAMGFGYDKMGLHAHHALNSHHLAHQLPPTSISQQSNPQPPASSPSMLMG